MINITCDGCKKTWEVTRTNEIPDNVVSMGCNWCPECEDSATSYYEEWYNESDDNGGLPEIPIGDNQLCLPFIFDELEIKQITHEEKTALANF